MNKEKKSRFGHIIACIAVVFGSLCIIDVIYTSGIGTKEIDGHAIWLLMLNGIFFLAGGIYYLRKTA